MNPLNELKSLLSARSKATNATVVSSTPTTVTVSTKTGVRQLTNNGSLFTPGDAVVVKDSVVLGRVKRDKDVSEYFI